MDADAAAKVGPDLNLHGMDGLQVMDASVVPAFARHRGAAGQRSSMLLPLMFVLCIGASLGIA